MARQITISPAGSAQVVRTAGELGSQTSSTHSFVGWNSKMSETGAFRGFLGLFKAEYSSAYSDVLQCLDDAYHAAFELEDAVAAARKDVLDADDQVSLTNRNLEVRTLTMTPGTGDGMDVPGWSDPVKGPLTAGNATHAAMNSPEIDDAIVNSGDDPPRHRSPHTHTPTHSPLAPLDAIESTVNVVHHAGEQADAHDDEQTMDDYLEDKGDR